MPSQQCKETWNEEHTENCADKYLCDRLVEHSATVRHGSGCSCVGCLCHNCHECPACQKTA